METHRVSSPVDVWSVFLVLLSRNQGLHRYVRRAWSCWWVWELFRYTVCFLTLQCTKVLQEQNYLCSLLLLRAVAVFSSSCLSIQNRPRMFTASLTCLCPHQGPLKVYTCWELVCYPTVAWGESCNLTCLFAAADLMTLKFSPCLRMAWGDFSFLCFFTYYVCSLLIR